MKLYVFSQRINEKRNAVSLVKREIAGMAERDIPALIQESTASQVSKILTGDYNLKLARQDYFISNQDKVINMVNFFYDLIKTITFIEYFHETL